MTIEQVTRQRDELLAELEALLAAVLWNWSRGASKDEDAAVDRARAAIPDGQWHSRQPATNGYSRFGASGDAT
jgi:hypothetical protein